MVRVAIFGVTLGNRGLSESAFWSEFIFRRFLSGSLGVLGAAGFVVSALDEGASGFPKKDVAIFWK